MKNKNREINTKIIDKEKIMYEKLEDMFEIMNNIKATVKSNVGERILEIKITKKNEIANQYSIDNSRMLCID